MIRATRWIPLLSTFGGTILAITGLRPRFVDSGGERLAGLGHPAFLAGVRLAANYACLIRLYRGGGRGDLALLLVNFAILMLTGARAPLACGLAVTTITLAFFSAPSMLDRRRCLLLIGAATLLPVLVLLDHSLTDIRLFNVLTAYTTDLSGRELLWPLFERAANQSCWLGWVLGRETSSFPLTVRSRSFCRPGRPTMNTCEWRSKGGARAWPAGGGLCPVGGPPYATSASD
jgi:hypothetical protein